MGIPINFLVGSKLSLHIGGRGVCKDTNWTPIPYKRRYKSLKITPKPPCLNPGKGKSLFVDSHFRRPNDYCKSKFVCPRARAL
jgi:hypothetical protein